MKLRRWDAFDDHFAIDYSARRFPITNHTHLLAAGVVGIREIKQMVRSELRMQRDRHQAAFAARLDIRNDEDRLRAQLSILVSAHATGALSEEHAPIRRPDDRPNYFQIRNDCFDFETRLREL